MLLLSPALAVSASAQSGGYDPPRRTVDGGGYMLGGTIGQPDAGVLQGGDYTPAGGFWGGVAVRYGIYPPLVLRNC